MAPFSDNRTKIWAISSDSLYLISLYLSGGSILDLWCSGDKKLQYLMAIGGIKTISFVDEGMATTSRFPQCLRFFRGLLSLSFRRPEDMLDQVDIVRYGLQSLSPTLERLSLVFWKSESVLLASNEDQTEYQASHSVDTASSNAETPSRLWPLSKYFPNLKVLELGCCGSSTSLLDDDIAHLPSTLTELAIVSNQSMLTTASFRHLRPQLTKLSFLPSSMSPVSDIFSLLPYHIESFELHSSIPVESLKEVKPSLLHLELKDILFQPAELSDVPGCLKSITLVDSDDLVLGKLPRHIQRLVTMISPDDVLNLPNTLPSGLKHLEIYGKVHLTSATKFPDHLNALIFNQPISWKFHDLPVPILPDGSELPLSSQSFAQLISRFPRYLQVLEMRMNGINPTIEYLPFNFPLLTKLTLYGGLKMSKSLFKSIPRTLRKLSLRFRRLEEGEEDSAQNSWFQFLPSTLDTLSISYHPPYNITPECFGYLPRNLKSLEMEVTGHASASDISSLPRHLTMVDLEIHTIASDATQFLPSNLRILTLGNLTDGLDLTNLPPNLFFLNAPCLNATLLPTQIPSLPSYLVYLHISSTTFDGPIEDFEWPIAIQSAYLAVHGSVINPEKRSDWQSGNFSTPDPRVIERYRNVN